MENEKQEKLTRRISTLPLEVTFIQSSTSHEYENTPETHWNGEQ